MKLSFLNLSLFIVTTIAFSTQAMHKPLVKWQEVSDSSKNIMTVTGQVKGTYFGIYGLIQVCKQVTIDTQKQLRLFGTLTPDNQLAIQLPFSVVATLYDQMAAEHLDDLCNQAKNAKKAQEETERKALIEYQNKKYG